MSNQELLQFYLEVKIPSRLGNLGFTPWKAWKRQWITIRRSVCSDSLDVQIGRNGGVIRITSDDMLCRTESRTRKFAFGIFSHFPKRRPCLYMAGGSETECQKWMSRIRNILRPSLLPVEENEFSVSIIENTFSRASGLSGLYGTLNMAADHVTVVDPSTSKIKIKWYWSMLGQFRVLLPELREDDEHICLIYTTKNFPSGEGEIKLFCLDGTRLIQRLLSRGRASSLLPSPAPKEVCSPRHHTVTTRFPQTNSQLRQTPSSPVLTSFHSLNRKLTRSLLASRRISRSEGDLRACFEQLQKNQNANEMEEEVGAKSSISSDDSTSNSFPKWKVASSLISAGIGLMLPNSKRQSPTAATTATEDIVDSVYPEYQTVYGEENEDDELGALNFTVRSHLKNVPPRRESGVSVASGVYEEIQDDLSLVNVLSPLVYNIVCVDEDEGCELPPPLPPRRCDIGTGRSVSESEDTRRDQGTLLPLPNLRYKSFSANNTPAPSPPNGMSRSNSTVMLKDVPQQSWQLPTEEMSSESHYIPMSPSRCDLGLTWDTESNYIKMSPLPFSRQQDETLYMTMASVNIV